MNRNFFVRLAFATHRVADALPRKEQISEEIREYANKILTDLILFVDKEVVRPEKKRDLLFQVKGQINDLLSCLERAKEGDWVNPENFDLLKEEYARIREFLEIFEGISFAERGAVGDLEQVQKREAVGRERTASSAKKKRKEPQGDTGSIPLAVSRVPAGQVGGLEEKARARDLTSRQKRIIDFLGTKQDAQVWELQKILPEVTKRTLRRDLDELLQKNLVERKGEWNAVAYELK